MRDVSVLAAPRPKRTSHSWWGEVVSTSPLRVHLEGEANPVEAAPVTCVWGLEVGDKVRGETTVDGVLVVLARGGGLGFENVDGVADVGQVPGLPASKLTSGTLDAARRWTGAPYREAAGKVATPASTSTVMTGVYHAAVTITFPAGRFTQVPVVTVGGHGGINRVSAVGHAPASVTTGGFVARVVNFGAAVEPTGEVHWHAVQMTNTNASG